MRFFYILLIKILCFGFFCGAQTAELTLKPSNEIDTFGWDVVPWARPLVEHNPFVTPQNPQEPVITFFYGGFFPYGMDQAVFDDIQPIPHDNDGAYASQAQHHLHSLYTHFYSLFFIENGLIQFTKPGWIEFQGLGLLGLVYLIEALRADLVGIKQGRYLVPNHLDEHSLNKAFHFLTNFLLKQFYALGNSLLGDIRFILSVQPKNQRTWLTDDGEIGLKRLPIAIRRLYIFYLTHLYPDKKDIGLRKRLWALLCEQPTKVEKIRR